MEYERAEELIESCTPTSAQLQYAVDAAIKAGYEINTTSERSWILTVTINSSPERTLGMCMRDNDYWVNSSAGQIWPTGDASSFNIDQPFRKALQTLILGPLVDDLPSDPIGQWCNQALGLGSLFSSYDLDDSPED
jgi:hypothetical protein